MFYPNFYPKRQRRHRRRDGPERRAYTGERTRGRPGSCRRRAGDPVRRPARGGRSTPAAAGMLSRSATAPRRRAVRRRTAAGPAELAAGARRGSRNVASRAYPGSPGRHVSLFWLPSVSRGGTGDGAGPAAGRRLGETGAVVAGFAVMATGNLLTARLGALRQFGEVTSEAGVVRLIGIIGPVMRCLWRKG